MKKRVTALLLALMMVLGLLSACAAEAPAAEEDGESVATGEESAGTDTDDTSTGLTEVPAQAREDIVSYLTDGAMSSTDPVLTVNGEEISAAEYIFQLVYQYSYTNYLFYISYGAGLDPTTVIDEEAGTTIGDALKDRAVSSSEMYAVLAAQAELEGLSLSEEQQSELDALAETEEDVLLLNGTTLDGLRGVYTRNYLAQNLQEYLLGEGGTMAPTAETLASYAEENGIYTCRYILLSTSDLEEDDTEGREAQRQQAQELYDQLSEVSAEELEETFTELQEEYNYDGNTDRYTFDADDSLVSGFREVVAELAPGELGMTEETDYGYFVLLRFEPDEETVREAYVSETFNAMIDEWLADMDAQTSEALDSLDATGFFERLTELQAFLNEQQSESETADDSDAAESEDGEDAAAQEETSGEES